jgi:hypothetical protein
MALNIATFGAGKAADIAVVGTIAIAEVDIHGYEGGYDRDDHDFHQ